MQRTINTPLETGKVTARVTANVHGHAPPQVPVPVTHAVGLTSGTPEWKRAAYVHGKEILAQIRQVTKVFKIDKNHPNKLNDYSVCDDGTRIYIHESFWSSVLHNFSIPNPLWISRGMYAPYEFWAITYAKESEKSLCCVL